jgi:hypothetical protein
MLGSCRDGASPRGRSSLSMPRPVVRKHQAGMSPAESRDHTAPPPGAGPCPAREEALWRTRRASSSERTRGVVLAGARRSRVIRPGAGNVSRLATPGPHRPPCAAGGALSWPGRGLQGHQVGTGLFHEQRARATSPALHGRRGIVLAEAFEASGAPLSCENRCFTDCFTKTLRPHGP